MNPEQIEWLRGWARKNSCKLVIDGEVGFGRQCVGILQDDPGEPLPQYLSYGWYGMAGDEKENQAITQIVAKVAPPDAYHKDECVAVLGEGFAALEQLYDWVKAIDEAGLVTESTPEADYGPGTSTMSLIAFGRRANVRRLIRDNSSTD